MLETKLQKLDTNTVLLAAALILGSIAIWASRSRKPAWVARLPVIKAQGMLNAQAAMSEGYEKYTKHGKLWVLRDPAHDMIMLPLDMMDDIRNRPLKEANGLEEVEDRLLGRYSMIGRQQPLFFHVLRSKMVPMSNSAASIKILLDECQDAVREDIGGTSEWKSFGVNALCSRIVSRMVGRMAAGTEFGHNPIWLKLAPQQVLTCATISFMLILFPWFCRPLVAPLLKPTWQMKAGQKQMHDLVKPLVEQRKRSKEARHDILQFFMDSQTEFDEKEVADSMLDLAILGILTTTMTMTDVLLHLAAHPEYQAMLRDEIAGILGDRPFGELTHADLVKMVKVDSFIKETLRMSTSPYGLSRKIKIDTIRLPDGNVLPQGCFVSVPTGGISRDPEYWDDPDTFDALRFYKLRQTPGEENRHQVVTLERLSFNFGSGPGACPGRFLVVNEVKILTAFILLGYDLKTDAESQNDPNRYSAKDKAQIFFRETQVA